MEFIDRKGNKVKKPTNKDVKKRSSAYGVYLLDGKVLMVKSGWVDLWELPGGGIKEGESVIEGLIREFKEEAEMEIQKLNPQVIASIKMNFYSDDIDQYFNSRMLFYHIIQAKKINWVKKEEDEIQEAAWVPVEELNYYNCKTYILAVIKKAIEISN